MLRMIDLSIKSQEVKLLERIKGLKNKTIHKLVQEIMKLEISRQRRKEQLNFQVEINLQLLRSNQVQGSINKTIKHFHPSKLVKELGGCKVNNRG